ncbi:MAG: hypothetical protein ACRYFX_00805 [Janthinobacterium lividum]
MARKLDQHSAILNQQGEAINRQEQRLDDIGEQIGDIINILKLSDARHAESEKRQDAMLAEIREQGRRTDVAVEALRAMVHKMEDTSSRVDAVTTSQRQIIQLTQLNTESLEDQEPRIQRLEDEVFRKAS